MPSYLPLWALYLQSFGSVAVAVVAAVIASFIQYRQWKTASEKLRFDLFSRRLAVYDAIYAEVMVVDGDATHQIANIDSALAGMAGYRFLFSASVVENIEQGRTLLMLIRTECGKVSLSHQRIMQYFRDYNAVRDRLSHHMTAALRFN